jgi:hypothetical protein
MGMGGQRHKRGGTHCTGGWVGTGPVWRGAKNFTPTGIRSQDRPFRSEMLYRQRYADSAIPTALCRQRYADSAIPTALCRQRYADSAKPKALCRQRYTDSAMPTAVYRQRYADSAIPTALCRQRYARPSLYYK